MTFRFLLVPGAILCLPGLSSAQAAESCPAFRWITLGTAGGPIPRADAAEPSNLLVAGDEHILVDTGDGTVNQLARKGIGLGQIRTVFISHHHLDHTGGLAAVIGLRWMVQNPGRLTVYGPPGTREMVDRILRSMAPQARVGFGVGSAVPAPADSVEVVELRGGGTARLGGLTVEAARNNHFDEDGVERKGGEQSLSYRFTLGKRSITYTGDTGSSAAVTRLAAGSDLLVSEVIDIDPLLRVMAPGVPPAFAASMEKHLRQHHLTPAQVGEMAAAAGAGSVVVTHIAGIGSQQMLESRIAAGVRTSYAGPLAVATDLASYDAGCRAGR
ncbi:MBL fold metallo-hydrolase [Sphingobium sp. DC-2]|uniref:MBL fold metallo-hydrolase n=1 Tax=Sphingobium sp. DC-2 TaxID=1303256 RepID=UPI00068A9A7B|nr:MBL fold metallo-hydrolase [Sphingobium sp. DC-2]